MSVGVYASIYPKSTDTLKYITANALWVSTVTDSRETVTQNPQRGFFIGIIKEEALLETCFDEAWEEFRVHNKLTDDQLTSLCERSPSGTLEAIEQTAQKMFDDMCQ